MASTLRATVTRDNPIIECDLRSTAPARAMMPPIVWVNCLRPPEGIQVFTFDDYVRTGIMSPGKRCAGACSLRASQHPDHGGTVRQTTLLRLLPDRCRPSAIGW